MRMSIALRSAMLLASLTGGAGLPTSGPGTPTCDVEKNVGSMTAKSRSAFIRSMRTDPTIPRQPIKPTRFMANLEKSRPFLLFCEECTGQKRTIQKGIRFTLAGEPDGAFPGHAKGPLPRHGSNEGAILAVICVAIQCCKSFTPQRSKLLTVLPKLASCFAA